ncbi:conserved hypothetical protein [Novosphingobium sp. 9U]|nr:conserved hypothetical protein [Novosphingobium sp. 9U]
MVLGSSSPDRDRNAAIYVSVIDGATFAELAVRYGISRGRVQKAYARERTNAWEARRQGETSYLDRPIPADV